MDPINHHKQSYISINQSKMANVVINGLLNFLSIQYDRLDRESLFSSIRECYSLKDALCAKEILIEECKKLDLSESISNSRKRRNNPNGDGHSRVVHDIIDIWKIIDHQKVGVTISTFTSADLSKANESEINLHDLFELISHMQKHIADIGSIVTRIDKRAEVSSSLNSSFGAAAPSSHFPTTPGRSLPWAPALSPSGGALQKNLWCFLFCNGSIV